MSKHSAHPSAAPSLAASRRSTAFLLTYALAYAGGVISYLPLLSLLLPLKIERVAGEARIDVLTGSVIAGALAASVSNIVFGILSDRAVARGGGRRRGMAIGIVATAASYIGISLATSPSTVILSVVIFQLAVNALLAPLMAIMADEIPDAQKGVAGGLLALGAPVASGVSALLIGTAMLGDAARFAIVPAAVAACLAPLLLTRAVRADEPAIIPERMLHRDLLTAWGARLLVQVAGTVLSLYLLYYFESVAPDIPPDILAPRIGHLLTIAFILPLPIAILLGRLSDRTGRRKPFLLAAAAVAALGIFGMAIADDWTEGAAGFCVYAIGSAVFLALHSAFAMQLLPSPEHRGRDLSLLNLTNTLPALLGPMLAWLLATPRDFDAVMLMLAVLTLGGGVAILAVRGRR
ncbi:MFS transporter [Sphingomonas sp. SUN019]|uniref:MFS transporter n=1 Tax=Sphingomonas sp. SUN019 TaxID=2937788 RepID=UPI002164AEBC|nr:MFS transporter [Sphingomonas sp. SUN019]UVO49731.1 MFS transporter [Sphingomonas sp. SUN019]